MTEATYDATEELRSWDDAVKQAKREDSARAVMLVMVTVYSIGFIMGGIVCGLVGVFAGWAIWG